MVDAFVKTRKDEELSPTRAIVSFVFCLDLLLFFSLSLLSSLDQLAHDFIARVRALYCYESSLHNREFMFRFVQLQR